MTQPTPSALLARRREDAGARSRRVPKPSLGTTFATLCCGAYLLWAILGHGSAASNKVVSDVVSPLVALVATLWSFWGIGRRGRPERDRRGFLSALLLSVGLAGYTTGAVLYGYYDLVLHQNPFPSWADAGYLLGTFTTVAGVLLLPSRPMPGVVRVRVLLDSLMVMAALVTFSWFFLLGPTVLDGDATLLAKVLGGGYPLADLAMLFCVLVLSAQSQEPAIRRVRNLIMVGVVGYVVSDVVYGYQSLHDTYQAGGPIDVGWMVANFLLSQAAVALRRLPSAPPGPGAAKAGQEARPTAFWRAMMPYALVPAVAALLEYVWRTKAAGGLATGVYAGSAALMALILVRQVLAIAENTRLYAYLQAAYKELEALATVDGMTGLANHRVFQDRLRQEIGAHREAEAPLCLLLVDVDRFKAYNDHFGHPAGDEALKTVAQALRENLRASDLAARYGGEEFAAILPNTDLATAERVAERLRAACEATAFPHRAVTLSIGVAAVGGRSAGALIEAADHALYAAKHGGRNQVALDGDVLRAGALRVEDGGAKDVLPAGWNLQTSRALGRDRLASEELLKGPSGPVIRALLAMLDLRDHDVERHSDRVMRFCLRLAEEAVSRGIVLVSPTEMNDLHLGALLHDIGKVGVPDAILHKPGALSPEEWDVVRRHPIQGAELLAGFPQLAGAMPVVRSHHERWDGGGYPDGLAGERIPLGARLFALADTLDAMGSDRPYRQARPFAEIRDEVRRMSGRQFDPSLVEAFLAIPEAEWASLRNGEAEIARAA